ncbi:MAG: asparagine synthase-related protein, partial [Chloroflexota bacterium]
SGVTVLLDGHGGDEVVSHGQGHLSELALSGRWLSLAREARGIARTYDEPVWPMMAAYLRYGLSQSATFRTAWRMGGAVWHGLHRTSPRAVAATADSGIVQASFSRRVGLEEREATRRRAQARAIRSERTLHQRVLTDGRQSLALEILDRVAAASGIEPRYPFWDKRLVEFCLALPARQKLRGGWPRSILRRALSGILPPEIQWRTDKTDFSPAIVRGLLTYERRQLDHLVMGDLADLEPYVDLPSLRLRYQRFISASTAGKPDMHGDLHTCWRAIALALWLRSRPADRRHDAAPPTHEDLSQGLAAAALPLASPAAT